MAVGIYVINWDEANLTFAVAHSQPVFVFVNGRKVEEVFVCSESQSFGVYGGKVVKAFQHFSMFQERFLISDDKFIMEIDFNYSLTRHFSNSASWMRLGLSQLS